MGLSIQQVPAQVPPPPHTDTQAHLQTRFSAAVTLANISLTKAGRSEGPPGGVATESLGFTVQPPARTFLKPMFVISTVLAGIAQDWSG